MGKVKKVQSNADENALKIAAESKSAIAKPKKNKKLANLEKLLENKSSLQTEQANVVDALKLNGKSGKTKTKKAKKQLSEQAQDDDAVAAAVAVEAAGEKQKLKKKKNKLVANAAVKSSKESAVETANATVEGKKKQKKQKQLNQQQTAEDEKQQPQSAAELESIKLQKKMAKKQKQKLKKQKIREKLAELGETAVSKKKVTASKQEKLLAKKNAIKEKRAKLNEQRPQGADAEAATIFVGNLPVNTKRVQLLRLFEKIGDVLSVRMRSAGGKPIFKMKQKKEAGSLNAYLLFKNAAIAEAALTINGTEFKGQQLRVTRGAKITSNNLTEHDTKRTIFVGNLKFSATEEKLRDIFSSCGEIDYVRCLRNGAKECKGVAYVCFKSADAVGLALELNETMLDERPIHVERFTVKKLGAKEKRDAAQANQQNKSTGQKQKTNKQSKKQQTNTAGAAAAASPQTNNADKKKSVFHGVKSNGIKKSKDKNKKKSNNQMKKLASKIAPKATTV